MKPLHHCGFAGMLRRIMSQGNDAFPPKDAAPAATAEASSQVSAEADPISDDSKASSKAKADSSADLQAKASGGEAQPSKATKSEVDSDERDLDADQKEPPRNRRRPSSTSSRRSSRDDDEDERQLPPETEEAVNVPKMQTVYMLGAMSVLTIILWFAAKLTCNVHPDQVREPKHFSTRELAADPKNAAFEFHHTFETGDFTTAFDLATGEMKRIVEAKFKECEQNADECARNQKKLAGTIDSTGKVLDRTENRATVELTSSYKSTPHPKTFSFDVVKEGDFWRVASRREVAVAAPNAASPAAPVEAPDQPASSSP